MRTYLEGLFNERSVNISTFGNMCPSLGTEYRLWVHKNECHASSVPVMMVDNVPQGIGTLGEKSLHASLKLWLSEPGDAFEVRVKGYCVDILRGDTIIEIQTGQFRVMKKKLGVLLDDHPVRLVYPVAGERWLTRVSEDGEVLSRRRSPKRGTVLQVFDELLSFPHLLSHPNFTLEVIIVCDEEHRCDDGKGSWRRKRVSILDRKLLHVLDHHIYRTPSDLAAILPVSLLQPFSAKDVAKELATPLRTARKTLYCLKRMGALTQVGKQGNTLLYSLADAHPNGVPL